MATTTAVTASATLRGHGLTDIPVLNPGGWFGKTWLIEVGGSFWPLFLIVEADTASDAIDELADNEKYGHQIIVDPADIVKYPDDYPEDSRTYAGNTGHVVDLDNVMVHGLDFYRHSKEPPFKCRYHVPGMIDPEGIDPLLYGIDPEDAIDDNE